VRIYTEFVRLTLRIRDKLLWTQILLLLFHTQLNLLPYLRDNLKKLAAAVSYFHIVVVDNFIFK